MPSSSGLVIDTPPSSDERIAATPEPAPIEVSPAPAAPIAAAPLQRSQARDAHGISFAGELRDLFNHDSAISARSSVQQIQLADKAAAFLELIAQMSPADYRQTIGKIIDVRLKQEPRTDRIEELRKAYSNIRELQDRVDDSPNSHFEAHLKAEISALKEMAEHQRVLALAMKPLDVYGALRWDVAKWELKQNGLNPPQGARIVSDDVGKAFSLMLEMYSLAHGTAEPLIRGKNGQPDMPAILPDGSFMTSMQVIARLAYPGGINIFNADNDRHRPNAFPVESTIVLRTGGKGILIEPGGKIKYFSGIEGKGEPDTLELVDGIPVFFGRELEVGPAMLHGQLTLGTHTFKPEGLMKGKTQDESDANKEIPINTSVSRFALEIERRGDKIYVFDRASRNNVDFAVTTPLRRPVTGTYSSQVIEEEGGGMTFGQTNYL